MDSARKLSDMRVSFICRDVTPATVIILLLACIGLVACDGSSSSAKGKAAADGTEVSSTGTPRTPASVQPASGPLNRRGQGARVEKSAFRRALTKFVACLRQDGVDVPASKASGRVRVLNMKAIDTSSTKFKTAWMKCRGEVDLGRAFHRPEPSRAQPGGSVAFGPG